MSGSYSISAFFILLLKAQFIASKLQLYISEGVTLLNCQCNVFCPSIAIMIAVFLKKTAAKKQLWYIQLHDFGNKNFLCTL